MQDDNLYPRTGANRITVPVEQVVEAQTEEAQTVRALPIIRDLVERFEDRIAFYNSIDSIPEDVLTLPDEFMHLVAAHKLTGRMIEAEYEYLKGLLEQHG